MSTIETNLQTVPVHVVNPHEFFHRQAQPPEKHPDYEVNTKTFTLKTGQTSGDPNGGVIIRILDRDPARKQAIIIVNSGTVYLCHSSTAAQASAADSSTVGGPQDGALVTAGQYVPPLCTTDPLWAVVPSDKASTGALVSVIAERRRS